jgi:transcriptional regulator with XRE-family HTH domain
MSATELEGNSETTPSGVLPLGDESFSWRLNVRMIARDFTPAELGAKANVPVRTIERWLNGAPLRRDRRTLDHLKAVAKQLRTTPLFLLTGEKR